MSDHTVPDADDSSATTTCSPYGQPVTRVTVRVKAEASMHAKARELALRGFEVFPLRGKLPAIPKTRGGCGFYDATTNLEQIDEWWLGDYARRNIGIRPPIGVNVLDVDPRKRGGLNLMELCAGRALPATLTATTGRGDAGFHAWYITGIDLPRQELCTGVDLKSHGNGFVVGPGSIHPDTRKPYTWDNDLPIAAAPEWLIDLCRKPDPQPPRQTTWNGGYWQRTRALDGLVDVVRKADAGSKGVSGRNDALNWAAFRAGQHVAVGHLTEPDVRQALTAAAAAVGLDDGEARRTIESGLTKGQNR
jgi:hypothetical protein